jgi:hypothetical protein
MNTRPNIAFAVARFTQYIIKPNSQCWAALKRLIRYLKGTRTKDIVYGIQLNPAIIDDNAACHIKGYTDSDWVSDISTCKLTSGYLFLGAGIPIAWRSTKQLIVVLSICEAEYIAASDVSREVIWLRNLLAEIDPFGAFATSLSQLYEPNYILFMLMAMDNQRAIALVILGS